ncbi:MAG: LemA family protein [Propionibacteriaceae bacterium]|nr:LemA family protein [Propionibacteriaceae bacterium]
MIALLITLVVLILILVGLALWVIGIYNRMIQGRNLVEQSWNQIDVELNRRYDLIPNLVSTIKGATTHEQSTLESVVGLRNQAAALASSNADPALRADIEGQLTTQLRNLFSVTVESYPDLKANANFMQLQNELAQIETRIANSRKYYNANVGTFNTLIESFPNSIIAGAAHFTKADYFQIQEPAARQVPTVDFSTAAPAAPVAPVAEPTQMAEPFTAPPDTTGADYAQPDFTQQSKVADQS